MPTADCLLALDQGTTSTRAMAFSLEGETLALRQQPFDQIYPQPGWVEHDPEVLWATSLTACREALAELGRKGLRAAALGITNQRETTVVWDRASGAPVSNAIVWQDRRTADVCRELEAAGAEAEVAEKTGLRLDPYFSATKLAWILDHTPGARAAADAGRLCFGTVDSFLIWRLTGGRAHVTDATNASRTALYDIGANRWDEDLCALFRVPMSGLPDVRDCAAEFGSTDAGLLGQALPITGVAGDQQAALVGQAGFAKGDLKSTYGTGAFLILNTGDTLVRSENRLLSTIAFRLDGRTTYGLEGSILSAGSTVQWLRDGLGLVARASEIEALARSAPDNGGVYLVPAFTGLGAPYWDPEARGALVGLTRGSGRAEIARAGLESAVFQTRDLFDAMAADGVRPATLKVDGGMTENGLMLQMLADILDVEVVRPQVTETTAFGAAALAGLGCGLFTSLEEIAALWRPDVRVTPAMSPATRDRLLAGWRRAVERARGASMSAFERVLGVQARLGECPVWSQREQALYFVDTKGQALHRFDPGNGEHEAFDLDEEIGCIGLRRGGGFIAGLRSGLWRLDAEARPVRQLAENPEDQTVSRFNDGRCDPLGRFLAGTLDEPKAGGMAHLYRYDSRGLQVLAGGLLTSNGLAFSPDGKTLYHADTPRFTVYRYIYDLGAGTVSDRSVFVRLTPGDTDRGRPDGAAVDAEGCYWAALYEGGRVHRYAPDGRLLSIHLVPAKRPTMVAFGGEDLRTLYVTSARDGAGEAELQRYPASGALFAMRVETPGQPEPLFDPEI